MAKKLPEIFQKPLYLALFLSVISIAISLQSFMQKSKKFEPNGREYTHYNNYQIFKQSYFHLIGNKDLYQLYPEEHWDYYKYSPAFALLMAPLAYLPDVLGLSLWNLLNCLILFFALWKLAFDSARKRLFAIGFILIELITSLQNSQSNALIAGLIIFAFIFLEKRQIALATLFIVLSIYMKLFGLAAVALFVFYPGKLKAAAYTIGWAVLFAVLPLIVVSLPQLIFLYKSWFGLLVNDHAVSSGLSVMGWLSSWFHITFSKAIIILLGAIVFCIPMLKFRYYKDIKFRLLLLSSLLVWIVIFNHKAESPTFVIAISGVSIWFFSQKQKIENMILLVIAFILTILSPTDIFPRTLREAYVVPYALKAVPCILIWFKIIFDSILYGNKNKMAKEIMHGD